MKILIVSDSPGFSTGMGVVHKNIGIQLQKKGYEVISLGWNPVGIIENKMPWKEYIPNKAYYYGEDIFDAIVAQERPDIVLTIGDIWTIRYIANCNTRGLFQWVGYVAIDGHTNENKVPPSWIPILNSMDKVIAYTNYGKNIIENSINELIEVIPHGVDSLVYYPVKDTGRLRDFYGIPKSKTLFLVVARNQTRKNIPEILQAWKVFLEKYNIKDAMLFLHMVFRDKSGWDIFELINMYKIGDTVCYFSEFADSISNINTIPEVKMNELYNMSDCLILTSGEGFGLPMMESMACGKPVIGINHSACKELISNDCGKLVSISHYVTGVHSTMRPYPEIVDLAENIYYMYNNTSDRINLGKNSLEKSKEYSWEIVGNQWDSLFKKIENPFIEECILERIS